MRLVIAGAALVLSSCHGSRITGEPDASDVADSPADPGIDTRIPWDVLELDEVDDPRPDLGPSECGNGVREAYEQCDDANDADWESLRVAADPRLLEYMPALGKLADGTSILGWSTAVAPGEGEILLKEIVAPGVGAAGPFRAERGHFMKRLPHIDVHPDGRYLVVWTSEGQDGDVDGIFAQRFDASGNPLGRLPW